MTYRVLISPRYAAMPSSAGKIPLGVAVAQLVSLACDVDPDELEAEAGLPNNGVLQATFRWLLDRFQAGEVIAWTRPLGGGLPQDLAKGYWQIDDPTPRFISSQMSLATPFDDGADADSWIFIHDEDYVFLWNLIVTAAEQQADIRRSLPRMGVKTTASARTTSSAITQPDERFLSIDEVIAKVSLSKSAIYARIADGKFPGPIKVNSSSRWLQSELDHWLATFRGV